MCVAGALLMALGLLLIGAAGRLESRAMLYAVLPISVIGVSSLNPSLQAMLSLSAAASEQGGTLGVGQSMAAMARILGPICGLVLYGYSVNLPYWSGAALMVLSLGLIWTLRTSGSEGMADEESVPVSSEA